MLSIRHQQRWSVRRASQVVCVTAGLFFVADSPNVLSAAVDDANTAIEVTPCRVILIKEAVLSCDKAGILSVVDVHEGDKVALGARLVQLRDDVPKAALDVAKKDSENTSKVEFAKKAEKVAITEHQMSLKANERQPGSLSELELYKQQLAIEKASAEVALSKFEIALSALRCKQAEAELKAYRVTAPFDAVVTRVHRRVGEAVRQGDPIVEIAATDVLRVEGYLSVRNAWRASVGDLAQVHIEIPDEDLLIEKQSFTGHVVFIDLKSQPVDGSVRVYVEVENPKGLLRAGLTARMAITPKQKRDGTTGPSTEETR